MLKLLTAYYKTRIKISKFFRMLSVPPGQMVLDIGGGDGPFARADLVCEKFIGSDTERDHPFLYDRPLVIADIHQLPFKDHAIDFIFCSHVLEHVTDPEKAIAELTRVGKRGYVEVPSEYHEYTAHSKRGHLWTIQHRKTDGALIFNQKTQSQINPHVEEVFHETLFNKDASYTLFHFKNLYKLFHIGFNWEKSFPFVVNRSRDGIQEETFEKGQMDSLDELRQKLKSQTLKRGLSPGPWIKRMIRTYFCRTNLKEWYRENLACPLCRTGFQQAVEKELTCSSCQQVFPVVNGVPVLTKEYAVPVKIKVS